MKLNELSAGSEITDNHGTDIIDHFLYSTKTLGGGTFPGGAPPSDAATRSLVQRNTIERDFDAALKFMGSSNVFDPNDFEGAVNVDISNNTFKNVKGEYIFLTGSNNQIHDNHGILYSASTDPTGNTKGGWYNPYAPIKGTSTNIRVPKMELTTFGGNTACIVSIDPKAGTTNVPGEANPLIGNELFNNGVTDPKGTPIQAPTNEAMDIFFDGARSMNTATPTSIPYLNNQLAIREAHDNKVTFTSSNSTSPRYDQATKVYQRVRTKYPTSHPLTPIVIGEVTNTLPPLSGSTYVQEIHALH